MSLWAPRTPREPQHRHVITKSGKPVTCCYSDCPKPGYDDIRIVKPSMQRAGDTATFIFCSEDHKRDYLHERRGTH